MYKMEYLSYLPEYMRRIREIKALAAVIDALLGESEDENDHILREGFISTAMDKGLSEWEKAFGLPSGGSVEQRRKRLLSRFIGEAPFTFEKVFSYLKMICGAENVKMDLGEHEYCIEVRIKPAYMNRAKAVEDLLRRVLPANIAYMIISDDATHRRLSEHTHAMLSNYTHDRIRYR